MLAETSDGFFTLLVGFFIKSGIITNDPKGIRTQEHRKAG
jgi:hypothetical protein